MSEYSHLCPKFNCKERYKNKDKLIQHIKDVHPNFKCQKCHQIDYLMSSQLCVNCDLKSRSRECVKCSQIDILWPGRLCHDCRKNSIF